jgi:hypothetical protein
MHCDTATNKLADINSQGNLITGLGDKHASLKTYIANKPAYSFQNSNRLLTENVIPLNKNDIYACGQSCGNGWRKVFNVYAKLVYAMASSHLVDYEKCKSWQEYRDESLLQERSNTALMFAPPIFESKVIPNQNASALHIIMGKGYAKSLIDEGYFDNSPFIEWVTPEFAVIPEKHTIICPYFDYRQLSNAKIIFLLELINKHAKLWGLHINSKSLIKSPYSCE